MSDSPENEGYRLEKQDKQDRQDKFKQSPKLYFYLGGLGGILAFVSISAWWDLTFGSFDVKNFVSDTLILIAIALTTMVLTDLLSQETNMNKVLGVFNMARNDYNAIHDNVAGILVYFSQWYFWFLSIENKRKREVYLVLHGFEGTEARKIVKYATFDDIEDIRKAPKYWVKKLPNGKKIPFKRIETEEQYEAAKSALKGEQDVKNTSYSEYLFTDSEAEINMSMFDRQKFLERRRKQSKKKAYIMRVVMILFVAVLMAALAPADDEEGGGKNRWWLLLKRISVFLTSFISGWLSGATDVTAKAAIIKDKASILTSFHDCYEKKLWQPKSEEQLDDEAIAEWEREQEGGEGVEFQRDPETIAVSPSET